MKHRALVFLAVLACGCSGAVVTDGGVEQDAGRRDAGRDDAGERDAGRDAGERDAGRDAGDHDAGDHDAGRSEDGGDDAGSGGGSDAGSGDAGSGGGPDAGSGDDAGSDGGSDAGPSGCTSDDECDALTPACDVASGACVECTTDAHCMDASAPHCDVASHACVLSTLLLAGVAGSLHVASYRDGAWDAASIATPDGLSGVGGGGVAVTGIDRGVLVLQGVSGGFFSAQWSGAWGLLERQGSFLDNALSAPHPVPGGAVVAHQRAVVSAPPTELARYDNGAGAWTSLAEATGAVGEPYTQPVVAADRSGVVLLILPPSGPTPYRWTSNAGGTWAAPADVPDTSGPSRFEPWSFATAARRAGTDEIVAAFRCGMFGGELRVATYSGGAWSPAVALASDLNTTSGRFALSVAPLRDGRAALAYVDTAGNLRLAFFDGTAWSAFTTVPLPDPVWLSYTDRQIRPIALAPGSDASAALELAYIAQCSACRWSRVVKHTRLSADGSTWSTPVTVRDENPFEFVYLAADPVP